MSTHIIRYQSGFRSAVTYHFLNLSMSDKHHGHMLKRLVPFLEVVDDLSISCRYHNIHVRFKSRNKKISGNPWPVLSRYDGV